MARLRSVAVPSAQWTSWPELLFGEHGYPRLREWLLGGVGRAQARLTQAHHWPNLPHMPPKKKKETDYVALSSPFMRVPKMSVEAARGLLTLGLKQIYQLEGRSAETLFSDLRKIRPDTPEHILPHFRLAVYYAENQPADPKMLELSVWRK